MWGVAGWRSASHSVITLGDGEEGKKNRGSGTKECRGALGWAGVEVVEVAVMVVMVVMGRT